MKRLPLCLLTILCFAGMLHAQEKFRPYTQQEKDRIVQVCTWFQQALPQTYGGWKVDKTDCLDFGWAQRDAHDVIVVAVDTKNKPLTNEYSFNLLFKNESDEFAQDQANAEQAAVTETLKGAGVDAAKRDALTTAASRLRLCGTITIKVSGNHRTDIEEDYQAAGSTVKIDLPVPAFAYYYTFSGTTAIYDENGEATTAVSPIDRAVIILSQQKPTTTTRFAGGKATYKTEVVHCTDIKDGASAPTELRNICIELSGDKRDLQKIIDSIDWKMLYSHLGN